MRSVWCAWTLAPEMLSSFTGRARCRAEPRGTRVQERWGMAERNDTRVAGSGMQLEIGSVRKLSPVSSKMSGVKGKEGPGSGLDWVWHHLSGIQNHCRDRPGDRLVAEKG